MARKPGPPSNTKPPKPQLRYDGGVGENAAILLGIILVGVMLTATAFVVGGYL